MFTKLHPAIGGIALCAATSGCLLVEHSGTPAPTGTLTTTWTLDGSSRADACAYHRIDRVRVIIVDGAGDLVADEQPACEDFDVSVDLSIGRYSSQVTLLQASGRAVTDTAVTGVRVLRDTEAFASVDFPTTSIH